MNALQLPSYGEVRSVWSWKLSCGVPLTKQRHVQLYYNNTRLLLTWQTFATSPTLCHGDTTPTPTPPQSFHSPGNRNIFALQASGHDSLDFLCQPARRFLPRSLSDCKSLVSIPPCPRCLSPSVSLTRYLQWVSKPLKLFPRRFDWQVLNLTTPRAAFMGWLTAWLWRAFARVAEPSVWFRGHRLTRARVDGVS